MKPVALLGLVAVALLVGLGVKRAGEREGALREKNRALVVANDSLTHRADSLARQHHSDTVRLVVTRRHTDSLLITDTVIHTDTVRQIVAAERKACDALVSTCEAEKANLRSQIGNVQARLDISEKRRRGFRVLGVPLGCVAGGVGSARGVGAGVGCGVRLGS